MTTHQQHQHTTSEYPFSTSPWTDPFRMMFDAQEQQDQSGAEAGMPAGASDNTASAPGTEAAPHGYSEVSYYPNR